MQKIAPSLRFDGQAEAAADFPPGISKPALRALAEAGYTRLAQLTQVSEADLRRLHGMGPKAIGILRTALEAIGTSFRSSAER